MREIQLTKGKVALVDDADYEWLNQFKWKAVQNKQGVWYAYRHRPENGKSKVRLMHRDIMKLDDPKIFVDHIYHDGLDNRKDHLRVCTRSENSRNSRSAKNSTSKYLGVSRNKKANTWTANIVVDKELIYLGFYNSEKDAALAYDRAAEKYFGEFANPNFPDDKTIPERNKYKPSGAGYRGVSIHGNSYRVGITVNKQRISLGTYKTAQIAAEVYNKKAIELLGQNAILNII